MFDNLIRREGIYETVSLALFIMNMPERERIAGPDRSSKKTR